MLTWLAAAAVPLLLHLWNRRNHREVSWAAMEYLLAALHKNSRRIRIEHWILLAVRTALIVAVVLAVAGPYLQQAAGNLAPGEPAHKIFVVDASYSMAFKPGEKSRFERARQLMLQMIDDSRQGDGFSLVLMSEPSRVLIGQPSLDAEAVRDEIESLELPHAGGNVAEALNLVKNIVQETAEQNSRWIRREIYILSDLGQSSWAVGDGDAVAKLAAASTELSDLASLAVIDLGQDEAPNAAVTSLNVLEPYATVRSDVSLEVGVRNFARKPANRRLQLLVDGQQIAERPIELGPGEQATENFRQRFSAAGNHTVEARLVGDALAVDDHRWLSLDVKESLRVLCVNGNAAMGGFRGDADYLVVALNPDLSTGQGVIRPEVITESRLSEIDLNTYDCVILSNVSQFTPDESQILSRFVRRGGGLIFFLGDRVLPERYNQQIGPGTTTPLLAATIGDAYAGSDLQFDPLDFAHPIIQPFEGNPQAGLLAPQVFKFWQLSTGKDFAGRVALAFAGSGDPAIVEHALRAGRSIVVAFPASLASVDRKTGEPWTVMPKLPVFVPLVQELVAHAVRPRINENNLLVGEPLVSLPGTAAQTVTVRRPSGRSDLVRTSAGASDGQVMFTETFQSGFYPVERAGAARTTYAVNVDPRESDLTKVDPADLPESFHILTRTQELRDESPAAIGLSKTVHSWFLYAALALLIGESSLAWFLGYRAS